jgi:hypothetical protein
MLPRTSLVIYKIDRLKIGVSEKSDHRGEEKSQCKLTVLKFTNHK